MNHLGSRTGFVGLEYTDPKKRLVQAPGAWYQGGMLPPPSRPRLECV